MSVEFLLKVRDGHQKVAEGHQQIADAYSEQLERQAPPEVKYDPKDFDKLFWEDLQGHKGPFSRTSKKATNDSEIFQALQTILKEHKGFTHIGSYRYWFDNQNPDVIDRRKK